MDVIQRLEPVIIEIERERECVCVVAHQAILRALYGYFMKVPLAVDTLHPALPRRCLPSNDLLSSSDHSAHLARPVLPCQNHPQSGGLSKHTACWHPSVQLLTAGLPQCQELAISRQHSVTGPQKGRVLSSSQIFLQDISIHNCCAMMS